MNVAPITLAEPAQKIFDGKAFPLVLCNDAQNKSLEDAVKWAKDNGAEVDKQLIEHGAVLFRGFPLSTAKDFDAFVKCFPYQNFHYEGGAAVRTQLTDRVFTANESPPSQLITFHHELAQHPVSPGHLFFFCEIAPAEGGETPICLSNLVYEKVKAKYPEFMAAVEEKGVIYNRVLPPEDDPTSAMGRSWKSTYWSDDRQEVEKRLQEGGYSYEWKDDGCLRTSTKVLPAVRTDSRTGKKVYFNQMVAAYTGWKDSRNDPKTAITLGDGTQLNQAVTPVVVIGRYIFSCQDTWQAMADTLKIMEEIAVATPWKNGDVLLVDNMLAYHSRRTFVPPRRILASLAQ